MKKIKIIIQVLIFLINILQKKEIKKYIPKKRNKNDYDEYFCKAQNKYNSDKVENQFNYHKYKMG